jgi:hypothetical protein
MLYHRDTTLNNSASFLYGCETWSFTLREGYRLIPNITRQIKSRRIRWAAHMARMAEDRKVYKVLVEKTEGKRQLGRPRGRWEDEIRWNLGRLAWGGGGVDSVSSE